MDVATADAVNWQTSICKISSDNRFDYLNQSATWKRLGKQRILGEKENEKIQFGQKSNGSVDGVDASGDAACGNRTDARYDAEK